MVVEVDWGDFAKALALSGFGFTLAVVTKLGKRDSANDRYGIAYNLRLYGKLTGWILGVGGALGSIRILLMLL